MQFPIPRKLQFTRKLQPLGNVMIVEVLFKACFAQKGSDMSASSPAPEPSPYLSEGSGVLSLSAFLQVRKPEHGPPWGVNITFCTCIRGEGWGLRREWAAESYALESHVWPHPGRSYPPTSWCSIGDMDVRAHCLDSQSSRSLNLSVLQFPHL